MKTCYYYFLYACLRFALWLRYRVHVKGFEKCSPKFLQKPKGIIFLANHPAEIDPCILVGLLWPRFRPHPVAVEYLFHNPIVRYLLDRLEALPVPSFDESSNSFKRRQIEKTYDKLKEYLDRKENLLIYPSGSLKKQAKEIIGGASGVHHILQENPEANVVLIRTTGLWGSSFSRALTGKSPAIVPTFAHGLKVIFKNFLFFTPRRDVTVEFEPAPADFPYKGSRKEINQYLEEWFNQGKEEPLKLISYSFYKEEFLPVSEAAAKKEKANVKVSEEIASKVRKEVAQLAGVAEDQIRPEQDLAGDLGLDSLDQAQLVNFLRESYGIMRVQPGDLVTVESVMIFASGQGESEQEEESKEEVVSWGLSRERPEVMFPKGKTIQEVFLRSCQRMKGLEACADARAGVFTYKKLKQVALVLADHFASLPEERIGVLLPASIPANLVILALLLAKKVPVMLNWTLGAKNIGSIIKQADLKVTLSAWSFLDRVENVELNGLDDQILLLEEMRRKITLKTKLKALIHSFLPTSWLLSQLKVRDISPSQPAVILFTSGTENIPKGVPLTHENILSNLRDGFASIKVEREDVLLGALPPFHSFGFSVTGLFPLFLGLRVFYSPNPTDGRRLCEAIENWKISLLCLAPTFFKNILRAGSKEQLSHLRYVVLGAEKTPAELYEKLAQINPKAKILEGYGITECSPVLTLNRMEAPSKGVGVPLPHVELLIVHPETHEVISPQQEGLILARGPNVFSGYLDPNLPSPFVETNGKQWYNTGDLGHLDPSGALILSGRLKRFVKIGGEMISLNAIEEVLNQAGQKKNWPLNPEQPSLAICSVEEEGKKGEIILFTTLDLSLDELNRELRDAGMSNIVKISSVIKIPFIPLLGSGKIDYRRLQTRLKEKGVK